MGKKYKVVRQDKHNTDQYLCGFYDTSDEAHNAIPSFIEKFWESSREDFHVKKVDPRFILNPVNTDYDHYIWSMIPHEERKRVMDSDAAAEILPDCLTCNSKRYWMLSQMIWEDWNIIDIGAGYNAQSYLFTKHKRYIAVNPNYLYNNDHWHMERFCAPGTDYYDMTGQDFIRNVLPMLNIDMEKTFAICHFVPDEECKEKVREKFPNCFVVYPK